MIRIPAYECMANEDIFKMEGKVDASMVDETGGLTIRNLCVFIQTLTEEHLNHYGLGLPFLFSKEKMWMIAWSNIAIERLPKEGETMVGHIWTSKPRVGLYCRNYAIYTQDGQPLVSLSSLFVLADCKTRKMTDTVPEIDALTIVKVENEQKAPKFIESFPESLGCYFENVVDASMIDVNGHLNYSYYLDWVDQIRREKTDRPVPASIWVQYMAEYLEGETVAMDYELVDDVLYVIAKNKEEISFQAKVSW